MRRIRQQTRDGADASKENGVLAIWLHLPLSILCGVSSGIAGVVGALRINRALGWPSQGFAGMSVLTVLAVIGPFATWLLFSKVLTARCSACGGICRVKKLPNPGHASARMYDTLHYRCERCGRTVDTGWGGGAGAG